MSYDEKSRKRKFQLIGWILFILCAVFFISSSIKYDDILMLVGSIVFLIACVVFIIPLLTIKGKNKKS